MVSQLYGIDNAKRLIPIGAHGASDTDEGGLVTRPIMTPDDLFSILTLDTKLATGDNIVVCTLPAGNFIYVISGITAFYASGTITSAFLYGLIGGITTYFEMIPNLPINTTMKYNNTLYMKANTWISFYGYVTVQPCVMKLSVYGYKIPYLA